MKEYGPTLTMLGKKKTGKETVAEPVTLLVVVGCGGGMYHGLPRLATWCHRRGSIRVLLIDPDKVEEKNAARQWGVGIGEYKVTVAMKALGTLGIYHVSPSWVGVDSHDRTGLEDIVGSRYLKAIGGELSRIVVCNGPDNHKTRMDVHEGCRLLATRTGVEVFEIVSGNTADDGYAYGCVHVPHHGLHTSFQIVSGGGLKSNPKGDVRPYACIGDWVPNHPDIPEEAERERRGEAEPMGCGALANVAAVADRVEQTVTGNQLTALCEWDLAEAMVAEDVVGEILWVHEETKGKNPRRVTKIYTNLKPR